MEPMKLRRNVEAQIQAKIIDYLRTREWVVKTTHGNAYQSGFPDLYATHAKYGMRWIEVKQATQFSFTAAQRIDFPNLCANGTPIWILTAATEFEYLKLFQPFNFHYYFLAHMEGYYDITKWKAGG